ncbi:MAG: hypothetical protein ACK4MX_05010 [Thermaurantiacus sp.]
MRTFAAALLVAAATGLGACGGGGQETGPTQEVTQITTEGDAVTVDTGTSERLAAGTAIVAESLPPFAPLYPGATVTGVGDATGTFVGGRVITMTTADSLDAVMEFYDDRISSTGATPTARTQTASEASRSVSMDGAPRGTISAAAGEGGTTITIIHAMMPGAQG